MTSPVFKTVLFVVAMTLIAVVAAAIKARAGAAGGVKTKARAVLSKNEQAMYWRLRETFPDSVVLAQVAFSALITSAREHRNRYSQKVADFVLLDRSTRVIAVIELDDSTHKGREDADAKRAALLETAGYRVVRFPRIPDVDALRAAIQPATPTPPPQDRVSISIVEK